MPTTPLSMSARRCLAWGLFMLMKCAPVCAAEWPTPEVLERGLAGTWQGTLAYRDYQSNRSFELPVNSRITVGPDGAMLTRVSAFDDGPKAGLVHITSVSLFDQTGSRVSTATFRKGRAVELRTQEVRVGSHSDETQWTVVYLETGLDGDKPALIRVTQTRKGDELLALKEVKPVGAPDSAYVFRNQTRLVRQSAASSP